MTNEPRKFSCINCGHPYDAYPPNDVFHIAQNKQCNENDCIEIKYECDNCNNKNTIFWDQKHLYIGKVG